MNLFILSLALLSIALFETAIFSHGVHTSAEPVATSISNVTLNKDLQGSHKIILSDSPIYQTYKSQLVSERIVSTDSVRIEQTIIENGI